MANLAAHAPARRADLLLQARSFFSLRVPANVWFLGITSFLTDISSEMLVASLPGYLVLHLGLGPIAFGVVDGLYHGLTSIARIASGLLADRARRYKEIAFVGYALSAACKALLLLSSTGPAIGATIAADRLGKGIRTAPRDAMIGLSVTTNDLAGAFGVHRALDTAGAALGPIAAFLVLAASRDAYDAVFLVSFAIAIVGLAALALFVRNPSATLVHDPAAGHARLGRLVAIPQFTTLTWVAVAVSIATISDGFLYLVLQRQTGLDPAQIPLLFAGTAFFFFVLAVPVGRIADRIGRRTVFVGGYVLLLLAYLIVLAPVSSPLRLALLLGLLGGYYAATDGVLAALASQILPPEIRGTGLGVLTTGVTLGRFGASVAFGYLWARSAASTVVSIYAAVLIIAIAFASVALRRAQPRLAS